MFKLSKQEKQHIIDLARKTAYIVHFDVRTSEYSNFYLDENGLILKAECFLCEDKYTGKIVDMYKLVSMHRVTVVYHDENNKYIREIVNNKPRSIEIVIDREELAYRRISIIEQALRSPAALKDQINEIKA